MQRWMTQGGKVLQIRSKSPLIIGRRNIRNGGEIASIAFFIQHRVKNYGVLHLLSMFDLQITLYKRSCESPLGFSQLQTPRGPHGVPTPSPMGFWWDFTWFFVLFRLNKFVFLLIFEKKLSYFLQTNPPFHFMKFIVLSDCVLAIRIITRAL